MNDPAATAQRQQVRQQSFLVGLITLHFRFTAVLGGSLLLSIMIECVGLHLFWQEQGWRHAQGMLIYELEQLPQNFTRSVLVQEPGRTAQKLVAHAYNGVLVQTGLIDWAEKVSGQAESNRHRAERDFRYHLGQAYGLLEDYLLTATYTSLVFLFCLMVLCLTLSLFVMAAFVGLVDGLVRRDIRRSAQGSNLDSSTTAPKPA